MDKHLVRVISREAVQNRFSCGRILNQRLKAENVITPLLKEARTNFTSGMAVNASKASNAMGETLGYVY